MGHSVDVTLREEKEEEKGEEGDNARRGAMELMYATGDGADPLTAGLQARGGRASLPRTLERSAPMTAADGQWWLGCFWAHLASYQKTAGQLKPKVVGPAQRRWIRGGGGGLIMLWAATLTSRMLGRLARSFPNSA
eukprot:5626635-Pyramimonas_sp.AAC.1